MTIVQWKPEFELGLQAMDDTHREFVAWLHRLDAATDEAFPAAFDEFVKHTQVHFDQENRWMSESGFPAINCHLGVHNDIYGALCKVQERLAEGRVDIGRTMLPLLSEWFEDHAEVMDSGLAQWLNQNRLAA